MQNSYATLKFDYDINSWSHWHDVKSNLLILSDHYSCRRRAEPVREVETRMESPTLSSSSTTSAASTSGRRKHFRLSALLLVFCIGQQQHRVLADQKQGFTLRYDADVNIGKLCHVTQSDQMMELKVAQKGATVVLLKKWHFSQLLEKFIPNLVTLVVCLKESKVQNARQCMNLTVKCLTTFFVFQCTDPSICSNIFAKYSIWPQLFAKDLKISNVVQFRQIWSHWSHWFRLDLEFFDFTKFLETDFLAAESTEN